MSLAGAAVSARSPLIWAALFVALAGCGRTRSSEELLHAMRPEGDAGAVDPELCAGLDECTCSVTPGCMPITTACWCPPASCGSTAPCPCAGGRFLGCNPRGAGCFTQCGLFSEASPRDGRGCVGCADPADCASAVARLPEVCPSTPPANAQWVCGGSFKDCGTICVNQLDTCASAGCALCERCSCETDLFDTCLYECLTLREHEHE